MLKTRKLWAQKLVARNLVARNLGVGNPGAKKLWAQNLKARILWIRNLGLGTLVKVNLIQGSWGPGGGILVRCLFFLCDRKGGDGGRRLEQKPRTW